MTTPRRAADLRNPFSTRHTRPGRLLPRVGDGAPFDLAALVARARLLEAAAIEGPHGSGKTNLLHAVAARLGAAGLLAGVVRPRSRRDAVVVLRAVRGARPETTLCVDSWECLGRAGALLVRWAATYRRVGLLVTSHRSAGMAALVCCTTTPALLEHLVRELPDHGGLIAAADIADAFAVHGGNLREALYDLYDRFEQRARDG